MISPYRDLPDHHFWRRSVSGRTPETLDPIIPSRFRFGREDRIATAGSCFAQHIARTLQSTGFTYLRAETGPSSVGATDENYSTFSARYGNIYTVRQLLQLFQRAFGLFDPAGRAWRRDDGRFVDPFRPVIQSEGFANEEDVLADREAHLAAVQTIFETCNVFIFTLGLTEGWRSQSDEAVVPLAPGVVAEAPAGESFVFHNFSVPEMSADLSLFLTLLRKVNPTVRVVLTVSPVALIATYARQHVLVANAYSKAALRVVADMAQHAFDFVDYFPSYEMITGPHARGRFFMEDLREVTAEGVDHVMRNFARHYLDETLVKSHVAAGSYVIREEDIRYQRALIESVSQVICDEEHIDRRA